MSFYFTFALHFVPWCHSSVFIRMENAHLAKKIDPFINFFYIYFVFTKRARISVDTYKIIFHAHDK